MPTWVACVARVRVDRVTGFVTVKLTIVADAGTVVDPDGANAQIEGAALWGLSMALHEGTAFEKGQVRVPIWIPTCRCASVTCGHGGRFVDGTEAPVGLGEPATTVVAPAVANAIFAAVGARLRHIPITPQAVKAATPHSG